MIAVHVMAQGSPSDMVPWLCGAVAVVVVGAVALSTWAIRSRRKPVASKRKGK